LKIEAEKVLFNFKWYRQEINSWRQHFLLVFEFVVPLITRLKKGNAKS